MFFIHYTMGTECLKFGVPSTKTMRWPMIYREPEELADIAIKAGFSPDRLKIVFEPLGIHGIAVCQK